MATDKPRIAILMAVYEPEMTWLREQLLSLNAQTYPNIKLYVRDDCSASVPFDSICSCVQDCIRAFPYEIVRNEENIGSNKTFERLTAQAEGEYFAYCDQDDIWLPEKLERLEGQLADSGSDLICSDVFLINGEGEQFASSITELRPRHVFLQGEGLASALIYRNFVIGCTSLIRAQRAKQALPFAEHMVHDHYLAFFCALHGPIEVYPNQLVCHRIHGNNQTGVLAHITDRNSYLKCHLNPFCNRVEELRKRVSLPELHTASEWARARTANALRLPGCMLALWKLRKVNRATTMFELFALRLPQFLLRPILRAIQAGKL